MPIVNCAKCGALLIGSKKFCSACGAPAPEAPVTRPSAPPGEHARATASAADPLASTLASRTGQGNEAAPKTPASASSDFGSTMKSASSRPPLVSAARAAGAGPSPGTPEAGPAPTGVTGGIRASAYGPPPPVPHPAASPHPAAVQPAAPQPLPQAPAAQPTFTPPPFSPSAGYAPAPAYPAQPGYAPQPAYPPAPGYGVPYGAAPGAPYPFPAIGARVLVLWADGNRYPGVVHQIAPGQSLIVFADGQQRWVDHQYLSPAP